MCRVRMGRVRVGEVVVVDGSASLSCPPRFAPGHENLNIEYEFRRGASLQGATVSLTIKDKDNATVHYSGVLGLGPDRRATSPWDGRDDAGHLIAPDRSPFTVTLAIGRAITRSARFEVKVDSITLWHRTNPYVADSIMMNNPNSTLDVAATVFIKDSNNVNRRIKTPVDVHFSFEEDANNTAKTSSYEYSPGHRLGKKGDAAEVYWERNATYHPDAAHTNSDNGYRTTCRVRTLTADGGDQGKAFIKFKPSGVGGDKFRLTARVLAADSGVVGAGGARQEVTAQTNWLTVWRQVSFSNIYEMQGENHVSRNATRAIISPVYDPAFVDYRAGAATAIDATHSVKYIGLWRNSTTPQENWATVKAKTAAETPTAEEIANATYTGTDAARVALVAPARTAINNKAQAWASRIDNAFHAALRTWVADAGIPNNTLVAIKYYHPKYSPGGGDSVTTEWNLGGASTPAWLRVNVFPNGRGGHFYTNRDPDAAWVSWGGLSHGNGIITVPKGNPDAEVKQVVRHESGHATKSFFQRQDFGPSLDHSASNAGIMYYTTAGGTTFTEREKKILRGIVP
ncbi:MAG: hypothetical protein HRF51_10015 [bacterium]